MVMTKYTASIATLTLNNKTTIHKKIQQDATVYQIFIIPYLYEAQDVSGDTPPIIRSLKLH
jgi:hypothetical protein